MVAGSVGNKEQLLSVINNLENAFETLRANLLAVKEAAYNLDLQNTVIEPEIDLERESGDELQQKSGDEVEPSGFALKIMEGHSITGIQGDWQHETRASVSEPKALQTYRQTVRLSRQSEASALTSNTAVGFGSGVQTERLTLRMSPLWMELNRRCTIALEEAAVKSGYSGLQSVVLHHIASYKKNKFQAWRTRSSRILNFETRHPCLEVIVPHSRFKISWDCASTIFLGSDSFVLPIMIAWDLEPNSIDTPGGIFLTIVTASSSLFWVLDMLITFNTGYYSSGTLVTERLQIAKKYLSSWLVFDLSLIVVDVVLASQAAVTNSAVGEIQNARSLRALRTFRYLRLMKLAQLNSIFEEFALSGGRPWILLVASIIKTLVGILIATHAISCAWFYIGRMSMEAGQMSWLELVSDDSLIDRTAAQNQYMYALQWVLTPPAPAPLDPSNSLERFFNVLMTLFTMTAMGAAISKFTSIMSEARASEAERTQKRREVRRYLRAESASVELTSRIMKFVEHKLATQESHAALDISLISPNLHMELQASQRHSCFDAHPLLQLTNEVYPFIYARICESSAKYVYSKDETVFLAGSFADRMLITSSGMYEIVGLDSRGDSTKFEGVRWFEESCLFIDNRVHLKTLVARSISDAFGFSGKDIREALTSSTACGHMFCEYAKEFLEQLSHETEWDDDFQAKCAFQAVKYNTTHMELHPDPTMQIDTFRRSYDDEEDELIGLDGKSPLRAFVEDAMTNVIKDQEQLRTGLEKTILELDPVRGAYKAFSRRKDRDRAISSCLGLLNLFADRYDLFTSPQDSALCMTEEQWMELRALCDWCMPSEEVAHVLIVLLAIFRLGKSKRIAHQLARHLRTKKDHGIIALVYHFSNVVPSVGDLSEKQRTLLIDLLQAHRAFSLCQLMQGECVPANLNCLYEILGDRMDLLGCYLMFSIGFIAGIEGGSGSRFLVAGRAKYVLLACRAMRAVMTSSPQAVYWSHLCDRSATLGIRVTTTLDLVLARLSCLGRVQDVNDYLKVRAAWLSLSTRSQDVLLKHFLADGMTERTVVLSHLPDCFVSANNNRFVQLNLLFEIIRDLVENLEVARDTAPADVKNNFSVSVDLSELAEFISDVKNPCVLRTCISRCRIRYFKDRIMLEMTEANWVRVEEPETDLSSLSGEVRGVLGILQRQETLSGSSGHIDVLSSGKDSNEVRGSSGILQTPETFSGSSGQTDELRSDQTNVLSSGQSDVLRTGVVQAI